MIIKWASNVFEPTFNSITIDQAFLYSNNHTWFLLLGYLPQFEGVLGLQLSLFKHFLQFVHRQSYQYSTQWIFARRAVVVVFKFSYRIQANVCPYVYKNDFHAGFNRALSCSSYFVLLNIGLGLLLAFNQQRRRQPTTTITTTTMVAI